MNLLQKIGRALRPGRNITAIQVAPQIYDVRIDGLAVGQVLRASVDTWYHLRPRVCADKDFEDVYGKGPFPTLKCASQSLVRDADTCLLHAEPGGHA